jgi:hypothetical protein
MSLCGTFGAAINMMQQLRSENDVAVIHRAADGILGARIERAFGMYAHEKRIITMATANLGGEMQHGFPSALPCLILF